MVSLRDTVNQSSPLLENQVGLKELKFEKGATENSADTSLIFKNQFLKTVRSTFPINSINKVI